MPRDDQAAAPLPFAAPPAPGEAIEAAPGVLWMRFNLPFALNHVNIYALEDGPGWAVLDTGIGDEPTKLAWEAAFAGPLRGRPLTRVIDTHHHPDHVGLAGWLCETHDVPLHMGETEYLTSRFYLSGRDAVHGDFQRDFYSRHGMDAGLVEAVVGRGHRYLEMLTGMPPRFVSMDAGETLDIGGRRFAILKGGGHAPDQAMLFCRDEGLFFAADQVLQRITPNISVHAPQPEGDPLGRFFRSLAAIKETVPDGTLTLPGHELPMTALHRRVDELRGHHDARCDQIMEMVAEGPLTTAEITPRLFRRQLDAHQTSFAFSEALAHVNRLLCDGRLVAADDDGVTRVSAA